MKTVRIVGSRLIQQATRVFSSKSADNPQHIVESVFGQVEIPSVSITEYIWKDIDRWHDRTALVCGASGRSLSYAALRQSSRDLGAGLLAGAKLSPGDVVALMLPNSPEFALCLLGCLQAGLVVSTINTTYGPGEIKHQLCDSGSKVVITFPGKENDVKAACKGQDISVIVCGGEAGLKIEDVISKGKGVSLPAPRKSTDLAVLPYSSGTTGLPKGVRLTHKNIVANLVQIAQPRVKLLQDTTSSHQDVQPCVLPFFHIYGLTIGLLSYLVGGAKVVSLPKFDPQLFLKCIKEHKATLLHVVPPLVQFLGNHPMVTKEMLDSLRVVANGAAPMSPSDAEKLLSKKDLIILSGYGLTESSPVITTCESFESDLYSVGLSMGSTQLKIANIDTGAIQDPGTCGEICCKGPQVMEGYHNNEEANKNTLKDGWLHTGDIGYVNKDGKLYIVDRLKELIKVKGFQVAPVELEELIRNHPGVADVGVVGCPDDRQGEVPVAFVVPRADAKPTSQQLMDHIASKVSAPYKKLAKVIFIEAIPRNVSGKILRKDLKKMLK